LKISFYFANKHYSIDFLKKRREWLTGCIKEEGYSLNSIDFIFCSDDYLLLINQKFLGHNYFTDIITFSDSKGLDIKGEIYISIDRVKENCKIYKCKFSEELNRVLVHGVLHLMNYDDFSHELKQQMTEKENYYLSTF
jgi:probable rRNA maturation factor